MSTRGCVRKLHPSAAALALALATIGALAAAGPGRAAPLVAIGGFDHYAGPLGQTTDGALGALVFSSGRGDLLLAGARYDDSAIGEGTSWSAGVGLGPVPLVTLRLHGSRIVADGTFRAWRAKVGPQLNLPGGRTVTLAYAHYQDNLGVRSNGAIAEAATPLVPTLTGRATASCASSPVGPPGLQGSLGLGWNVTRNFELLGEVGLVRNAVGAIGQPSPGGGGPLGGLPILGGGAAEPGPAPEATRQVDSTLLLGVRVTLP